MDVPGIVRERLGDEQRMTSVNVGGDDRVYVTPPKTLVYHASGLFSRESIDEYSHDAKRFDISADRREATFAFEYDDGVEGFSVPRERIETVLPPVLAGVLRSSGWIDDDESIEESYRFGERTLVVTDRRLLTSVGEAVWDDDHESYDYANVTSIDFEDDGFVIGIDGHRRRIDLDDEGAREAYGTLEDALCAYHGVDSVAELGDHGRTTDEASTETDADRSKEIAEAENDSPVSSPATAGNAPNPEIPEATETDRIEFDPPRDETAPGAAPGTGNDGGTNADDETDDGSTDGGSHDTDAGTGGENGDADELISAERPTVADELGALRESVERQTELVERTNELLERLADAEERRTTDDQ